MLFVLFIIPYRCYLWAYNYQKTYSVSTIFYCVCVRSEYLGGNIKLMFSDENVFFIFVYYPISLAATEMF